MPFTLTGPNSGPAGEGNRNLGSREEIMNTESNKIILEQKIESTKDLLQILLKRRILMDKDIMLTKAHLYDMEKKLEGM